MMRWSKEPVTVILWTGWKALPVPHRLYPDAAHSQDAALRRVDDGDELIHVIHAQVGDGDAAAAHVRRGQLALPGLFDLCLVAAPIPSRPLDVDLLDHGTTSAPSSSHGQTHIGVLVDPDLAVFVPGVHQGNFREATAMALAMISL